VVAAVQVLAHVSGGESDDQPSVGELHDWKAPGEAELGQAPKPLPDRGDKRPGLTLPQGLWHRQPPLGRTGAGAAMGVRLRMTWSS
jgi:hypothetical protein